MNTSQENFQSILAYAVRRGCKKRIVPKKKKDQEFIMNSRSFFLFMGFSLLSEMEFFAVPKNGISLNI